MPPITPFSFGPECAISSGDGVARRDGLFFDPVGVRQLTDDARDERRRHARPERCIVVLHEQRYLQHGAKLLVVAEALDLRRRTPAGRHGDHGIGPFVLSVAGKGDRPVGRTGRDPDHYGDRSVDLLDRALGHPEPLLVRKRPVLRSVDEGDEAVGSPLQAELYFALKTGEVERAVGREGRAEDGKDAPPTRIGATCSG